MIIKKIFRKEKVLLLEEKNKPIASILEKAEIIELPPDVRGLKKYQILENDEKTKTIYSEGINLKKLKRNKSYRKKVEELLSEENFQQKEFEAAIYGMSEKGIYVGSIKDIKKHNKEKNKRKKKISLQEMYTIIRKCQNARRKMQEVENTEKEI